MGHFTNGYNIGLKVQQGDYESEQYEKDLKELLQFSTYNECKEWYNGFHKGMLDIDLANLEKAFIILKEQTESKPNE